MGARRSLTVSEARGGSCYPSLATNRRGQRSGTFAAHDRRVYWRPSGVSSAPTYPVGEASTSITFAHSSVRPDRLNARAAVRLRRRCESPNGCPVLPHRAQRLPNPPNPLSISATRCTHARPAAQPSGIASPPCRTAALGAVRRVACGVGCVGLAAGRSFVSEWLHLRTFWSGRMGRRRIEVCRQPPDAMTDGRARVPPKQEQHKTETSDDAPAHSALACCDWQRPGALAS